MSKSREIAVLEENTERKPHFMRDSRGIVLKKLTSLLDSSENVSFSRLPYYHMLHLIPFLSPNNPVFVGN